MKSKGDEMELKKIEGDRDISGFCLLEPYEDQVSVEDEQILPVNVFLKNIRLVGQETLWYVIVYSEGRLHIAKFNTAEVPLATPKPLLPGGKSCAVSKLIRFKKQVDSKNRSFIFLGI